MEALLDELLPTIPVEGKKYKDIVESVPFEKRRLLVGALKIGKSRGVLRQDVTLVDGVIVHNYYRVEA